MRQVSMLLYEKIVDSAVARIGQHQCPRQESFENTENELDSVAVVESIPAETIHSAIVYAKEVEDCFVCFNLAADAVLIECGHGGMCSGEIP